MTTPPDSPLTLGSVMPQQQQTGRRRWPIVVALSLLVLAAVGAGAYYLLPGSPGAGPDDFAIKGQLVLNGNIGQDGTSYCWGLGGFTDIKTGAQVTVTDAAGTTVALGELGQGVPTGFTGCQFAFVIDGVPAGHSFYGLEVSHRGRVQYPEADLRDSEVVLQLSAV